VYNEGQRLIGTVEAELPNLQALTQSVKGAGIAGEVDSPVLGHFQDTTMKLTFRTVTPDIATILSQQYHHIELWAAVQYLNVETGKFEVGQQKVITRAMPKAYNLGKFAVGELQGTEMEFTLNYIRVLYKGDELYELDKYNGKFTVGNTNMLADVWRAIGLT